MGGITFLDFHTGQEVVTPFLQHVMDSLTLSPSVLMEQHWNVIGWNEAACVVFGDFFY
jgi:hypothetical protein